jgi:hypothetical protein
MTAVALVSFMGRLVHGTSVQAQDLIAAARKHGTERGFRLIGQKLLGSLRGRSAPRLSVCLALHRHGCAGCAKGRKAADDAGAQM